MPDAALDAAFDALLDAVLEADVELVTVLSSSLRAANAARAFSADTETPGLK